MSTFKIQCPSCGTIYSLPDLWKESIHNKQVTCDECKRPWVTHPETGPLKSTPEPLRIDLSTYRMKQPEPTASSTNPNSPSSPPAPTTQVTQQVTLPATPGPPPLHASAPPSGSTPTPTREEDPLDGTVMDMMADGVARYTRENPLATLDVGLVFVEGPHKGKGYRINKTPSVIGRTTGDVKIPDGRVSGKHAELEIIGPGQYSLKDLASTNGTLVNDRRISTTQIENGDVISFGGNKLKFVARPKRRKGLGNVDQG